MSVYVSCASGDGAAAAELAAALEKHNMPCTVGPQPSGPAAEGAMVVYFSEAAKADPSILLDFQVAVKREIPIIGLRVAAGFLSNEIDQLNPRVDWINAIIGRPADYYEKVASRVGEVLSVRVEERTVPPLQFEPSEVGVPSPPRPQAPPIATDSPARPQAEISSHGDAPFGVLLVNSGHNQIEVIKCVREVTGLDLVEAKNLVEQAPSLIKTTQTRAEAEGLKSYFSSSGADVHIEPGWTGRGVVLPESRATVAPPWPDALPQYDVLLTSPGANKLYSINAIRMVSRLGLAQANAITDSQMPVSLVRVATREDAERIRDQLYAAGASADVVEASPATEPNVQPLPEKPTGGGCCSIGCVVVFAIVFGLVVLAVIFGEG